MRNYLIKKLGYIVFILLGVSMLTFALGRLAPGDPVQAVLSGIDDPMTEEEMQDAREKLGLNDSIGKQYVTWLSNVLKGDFGYSINSGELVSEEIIRRIVPTIELAVASIIVMLMISFPIGIISALYKDKVPDNVIRFFNIINISLPTFCIGIIFILIMGVKLKLLPVMGRDGIKSLILPSLTLGISMSGGLIRLIRNEILNNIEKDHVYAATVFGVKKHKILINNIVLNSMNAIVTNIGIYIGALIGGSAVIESLFGWPGLGNYVIQAINNRDYAVIQAYALLMAVVYMLINMLVDFICHLIDPRMRGAKSEA